MVREGELPFSGIFQTQLRWLIADIVNNVFRFFCQVPPVIGERDDYDQLTEVPVRTQHRGAPDFMDLCEAEVNTEWFMITNSYHSVARHVDLMFTPGTFIPVIPFTPATYAFCFKYPYCKENVNLAQVSRMTHISLFHAKGGVYSDDCLSHSSTSLPRSPNNLTAHQTRS
jgi:hypothetical protein